MKTIPWNKPLSGPDRQAYILLKSTQNSPSCPAGVDFHVFVNLLAQGYWDKAVTYIRKWNPFPVVCGSVCKHSCELPLFRESFHEHPAVTQIKQSIMGHEISGHFMPPQAYSKRYPQKIAIVGAGLEGLTLALDLREFGYEVTLFEEREEAGGDLRNIVPPVLHPVLDKEIALVQESGIKIFLNKKIDEIASLQQTFQLLVLATGSSTIPLWKQWGICGEEGPSPDGTTPFANVFAIHYKGDNPEQVAERIGKAHDLADHVHACLQNIPVTQKERHDLPVLRPYLQACPHRATEHWSHGKKDDVSQLASTAKCLNCGLWESPDRFKGEGCLNCAQCEVCSSSCHFKQVLAETQGRSFLVKTTLEVAKKVAEKEDFFLNSSGDALRLYNLTPVVEEEKCIACGRCEEVCPYRAIDVSFRKGKSPVAVVNFEACRSCSLCVAACPTMALSQGPLTPNSHALPKDGKIAVTCRWSGNFEDFTPESGQMKTLCTRHLTPRILISLLRSGATEVFVSSCPPDHCHYAGGCAEVQERTEACTQLVQETGLAQEVFSHRVLGRSRRSCIAPQEGEASFFAGQSERAFSNTLGESLLSLQIMQALSSQEESTGKPKNGLLAGSLSLLERLLEIEGMLPRGTFLESLRILLHTCDIPVFLPKADAGIDLNGNDRALPSLKEIQEKALAKVVDAGKKYDVERWIAATPEFYENLVQSAVLPKGIVPLPSLLQGKLSFRPFPKAVAFHLPCAHTGYAQALLKKGELSFDPESLAGTPRMSVPMKQFCDAALKLLGEIPGLDLSILEDSCGHTFWQSHHRSQRDVAYRLFAQAESSQADTIVCLSPFCHSHLRFITRQGAWKETAVQVVDLYSFLLGCLSGPRK